MGTGGWGLGGGDWENGDRELGDWGWGNGDRELGDWGWGDGDRELSILPSVLSHPFIASRLMYITFSK